MDYLYDNWEAVVGLEVHVELNTASKLFSGARNRFGDEPNTNISPTCTGMPGSLPVLNRVAVEKAVLFGLAVQGEIAMRSRFDRKSYFYPDSPRNFQITQFDYPIVRGGRIKAIVGGQEKIFELAQTHLEDDAGTLKHFGNFAGVDYNRAGVPLIEIVSKPCMFSAEDAVAYAISLVSLVEYLEISDCSMEEGSVRFDVNISVRPKGTTELRNKVEIKNLNSFAFMAQALEAEKRRQVDAYLASPTEDPKKVVLPSTYRWDPEKKITVLMRSKETADDYKYFPEPDLPVLKLTKSFVDSLREKLPELPFDKFQRYIKEFHLPEESVGILVGDKRLATFFEKAVTLCSNPRALSNWITVEFAGRFKGADVSLVSSGISPEAVADLVNKIEDGTLTGKIAKEIADAMVENPEKTPTSIIEENPSILPMSDEGALKEIVMKVIQENPESVHDYRNGKTKALGFLVGKIMKETQGKAPPTKVNTLLLAEINK